MKPNKTLIYNAYKEGIIVANKIKEQFKLNNQEIKRRIFLIQKDNLTTK
jgi:hypothetical protein